MRRESVNLSNVRMFLDVCSRIWDDRSSSALFSSKTRAKCLKLNANVKRIVLSVSK